MKQAWTQLLSSEKFDSQAASDIAQKFYEIEYWKGWSARKNALIEFANLTAKKIDSHGANRTLLVFAIIFNEFHEEWNPELQNAVVNFVNHNAEKLDAWSMGQVMLMFQQSKQNWPPNFKNYWKKFISSDKFDANSIIYDFTNISNNWTSDSKIAWQELLSYQKLDPKHLDIMITQFNRNPNVRSIDRVSTILALNSLLPENKKIIISQNVIEWFYKMLSKHKKSCFKNLFSEILNE